MTKSPPRYFVPAKNVRVEDVIKKSRFITTLSNVTTVEDARQVLDEARGAWPDATHHCYAWIVGEPGATNWVKLSDDGEPQGSAGRPMLAVLEGEKVGDVIAVVTRYYGGTKLGRGGLVRAYGGGVKLAIEEAGLKGVIATRRCLLSCDYAALSTVKYLCPAHEVEVQSESFAERVQLVVELPEENLDGFVGVLADKCGMQVKLSDLSESDDLQPAIPRHKMNR